MYSPAQDGETHINIYSKGNTELGILLSNFAETPFLHPVHGAFSSIEAYIYWLGCKNEKLRFTTGFEAKKLGRELSNPDSFYSENDFQTLIKIALRQKVKQNKKITQLLKESELPLAHYYVYNGKTYNPRKWNWVVHELVLIRTALQNDNTEYLDRDNDFRPVEPVKAHEIELDTKYGKVKGGGKRKMPSLSKLKGLKMIPDSKSQTYYKDQEPTPEQKAVIHSDLDRMLVSACPGSGKTTTLVNRVRFLPEGEKKLVLAFNKKAAEEFKSRMGFCKNVDVMTFHAFCLKQIMKNPTKFGYSQKPDLDTDASIFGMICLANELNPKRGWDGIRADGDAAMHIECTYYTDELKEQLKDFNKDIKAAGKRVAEIENYLVNIPMDMVDERKMIKHKLHAALGDLYEINTKKYLLKVRQHLLDFDTLTFSSMVRLVAEHRDAIRVNYDHVMIDEFQDVDRFQYDIITAIFENNPVKTIVCVGDPNQRIYTWRGALDNSFTSMQNDIKATPLKLTMNFRSKDEILNISEKICPVGMTGVRGSDSESVKLFNEATRDESLEQFLNKVSEPSEAIILVRVNRQCIQYQLKLAKRGIPVMVLGLGDFFSFKHIKLAMKYRQENKSYNELFESDEWIKLTSSRACRVNPEKVEEMEEDVKFIMDCPDEDIRALKENGNDKSGIRISTVHKVKGLEFDTVLMDSVNPQETFLYYVGLTRAQNKLLVINKQKEFDEFMLSQF